MRIALAVAALALAAVPAVAQLNGQTGTCVYACVPGSACVCVPGSVVPLSLPLQAAPAPEAPDPAALFQQQLQLLQQQQQLEQLRREHQEQEQRFQQFRDRGNDHDRPGAPGPH